MACEAESLRLFGTIDRRTSHMDQARKERVKSVHTALRTASSQPVASLIQAKPHLNYIPVSAKNVFARSGAAIQVYTVEPL